MIVARSGVPPAGDADDLGVWWLREFGRIWSEADPALMQRATWRLGRDLSETLGRLLADEVRSSRSLLAVPGRPVELEPELIGGYLFGRPVGEAVGQDFMTLEVDDVPGWRAVRG